MKVDKLNMFYHNYDVMLNDVLQEFAPDFNNNHEDGFDMTDRLPQWVLMLDSTLVTPYVADNVLFAAGKYVPK